MKLGPPENFSEKKRNLKSTKFSVILKTKKIHFSDDVLKHSQATNRRETDSPYALDTLLSKSAQNNPHKSILTWY